MNQEIDPIRSECQASPREACQCLEDDEVLEFRLIRQHLLELSRLSFWE